MSLQKSPKFNAEPAYWEQKKDVEVAVGEGVGGGGEEGRELELFFRGITLWLKSQGMPIGVYELAAESKSKHKKERKKSII